MSLPTQTRTVDPFASYNSNTVNALTRIVTGGQDSILGAVPVRATRLNGNSLTISSGSVIKDDVLIELSASTLDFTLSSNYVNQGPGNWDQVGYYYVVLEYVYVKSKPAPQAEIKIIRPSERTNPSYFNSSHMILKVVDVTGSFTIAGQTSLLDFDPENVSNYVHVTPAATPWTSEVSSDYNVAVTDDTIYASGTETIINLMTASSAPNKRVTIVNKNGTNLRVIVKPSGSDTIETKSEIYLVNRFNAVTLVPDAVANMWYEV